MKIEYKLVLFCTERIRILPICNLIAYDRKIIFFAGMEDDSNISYQTAKTYKRRLKLEGFEIQ
jgi:hypothetical protein